MRFKPYTLVPIILFRFEFPLWLLGLLSLPLFWLLRQNVARWRARTWDALGGPPTRQRLVDPVAERHEAARFVWTLVGLAFCFLALANPQASGDREPVRSEGLDVLLAIDVSRSMNCADVPPNRMALAREFARKLLDRLSGDRVGLITVAGRAELAMPLTDDYASLRMLLDNLTPDQAALQGTALGEALRVARTSAEFSGGPSPAIVLISDGENHEGDAESEAAAAKAAGLLVITVGVGSAQGAPVPEQGGGYKTLADGSPVISRMDPQMLAQIAQAGGGTFLPLENVSGAASAVMERLSVLERHGFESLVYRNYRSFYQWCLALGLLALAVGWMGPLALFRRK